MTELIKLSAYFQPFNFYSFGFFLLIFLSFDIWGTYIKSLLLQKKVDTSRIINWLIGLGFFSFFWFILRFFFAPNQFRVIVSIIALDLIALPYYLRSAAPKKLKTALWKLKIPLLIIIPFLPAVFVKISLPPYYSDEMAYHFISPAQLNNLTTWQFNSDFYPNLPQTFDLFFVLAFALSKTYSIVRLVHFTILVTAMMFAFSSLKRLFGRLPAYVFLVTFFSLPQALVLVATIGFVDVATYSFMLIGMMLFLEFILQPSPAALNISAIFWGLALGTKYTSLSAFAALLLAAALFILPKIKLKKLFLPTLLLILFGGYWYLKNLLAYGNPVYPLFGQASTINFTGNWTTPVDLLHLRSILRDLFPGNPFLRLLVLFSPLLIFFNKAKKTKTISLFLLSAIIIELLLLRQFSGFYARYHQHLQLWSLLLMSIQLSNKYSKKNWHLITSIIFLILFATLTGSFIQTMKQTYSRNFLRPQEISYSLGKIDIYDWIKAELPDIYNVIIWCENPPQDKQVILSPLDPDMIWFEKAGFMRSFLTNCQLGKDIPLEGVPLENALEVATEKKLQFSTASINQCIPDSQVGPKRVIKDDLDKRTMYLRHLSNLLICQSQEIIPHLYYFNYENLSH